MVKRHKAKRLYLPAAMQLEVSTILFYFFLSAVGLQVVYWLFFILGMLHLQSPQEVDKSKLPGISVIVAAKNELLNLKELIPALMAQDHPDYEVIIINDRSDDGTDEFLLKEEQKYDKLKALHIYDLPDHISGKKYAITLGIKAAKNKQVLLTDADCRPNTDSWVAKMASGFGGSTDIVLGFSNYIRLKGFLNYFIRFETLLTGIQYMGSAANNRPFMGVGRNLAYKKDLFLESKGFFGYQELMGGDDDLFINKHATARNTVTLAGKEAITLSKPKQSWRTYWQQKLRHMHIGKHYSLKSKITLALFNLSWIFTWILGMGCLIAWFRPEWVIFSLLLREILVLISFITGTKKLGISFGIAGIIFVDILYVIYYIFVGIKALVVKNISWA